MLFHPTLMPDFVYNGPWEWYKFQVNSIVYWFCYYHSREDPQRKMCELSINAHHILTFKADTDVAEFIQIMKNGVVEDEDTAELWKVVRTLERQDKIEKMM